MPDRKRVLFISPQPFFEWRGSPIRVKFNVKALHDLGYDVDLLTLPIGTEQPDLGVRVIRAWNLFGSKNISIGPSALKLWFDFILLIQGLGLVLKNRYSVLHGTEETGFLCYLLSFFSKAKCIYEKHSDSGSYQGGVFKSTILKVYNLVEKLTIRRSDLVICTGPGLKQQARSISAKTNIVEIADIPSSLVTSDMSKTAGIRNQFAQADEILVTYVGSFAEYQGVDIIFDAIPKVVDPKIMNPKVIDPKVMNPKVIDKHQKIRFLIIGGNKQEIEHYQSQLERNGVSERVHFPGKIDPDLLPDYLAASDILLAPRKSGINSPLKILDYFKAGGAIIATNTVANQRLLSEDNALLCEFDADSFAQAIITLSKDSSHRQRISDNAHRLYQSRYNFKEFTRQLDAAYQSLL